MKTIELVMTLAVAAGALGGCASGGYYGGPDGAGFDAYYDDFYGPYTDGYWGRDRHFWYRPAHGRGFVRDEANHFHRENGGAGFHGVHANHGMFHRH